MLQVHLSTYQVFAFHDKAGLKSFLVQLYKQSVTIKAFYSLRKLHTEINDTLVHYENHWSIGLIDIGLWDYVAPNVNCCSDLT